MRKKVLIVEDDSLTASIFRMFLEELKYDLLGVVDDAHKVIQLCDDLKPDVILMDIHLNGELDGIQICEMIKSRFNIPIIFLSSDTNEDTLQRVIKTHSYGYMVKPIDKNELSVTIELAYYKHQFDVEQQKRENSYRKFITDLPEAIVLVDAEGKISYVNYYGLRLFNTVYIDDLLGQPFGTFLVDIDPVNFKEWVNDAIILDRSMERKGLIFKNVFGNETNIDLNGTVVQFNGKAGVQLILKNVDEQIAYKKCLAETTEIMDCLPLGVIVFNTNGTVKSVNKKAAEILKTERDKIIGIPYSDLIISGKQKSFVEDLLLPLEKKDSYRVSLKIEGNLYRLMVSGFKNEKNKITAVLCCIESI